MTLDPMKCEVFLGDCLEILKTWPENSVDACVTDPPYGLEFMGQHWDHGVPAADVWREVLRVLKPGGHLLAFAGTRTQHRMASAIEDAGFEIRDMIAWVYGSGFPKSLDVSKAIDKMGGIDTEAFKIDLRKAIENSGKSRAEIDQLCGFTMRFDTPYEADPIGWGVSLPSPEKWERIAEVLGVPSGKWKQLIERVWRGRAGDIISENTSMSGGNLERTDKGLPIINAAKQWQGWGTALKPALEPITVARKPLIGTVAQNVLTHGTGALNIDGGRVPTRGEANPSIARRQGAINHLSDRPAAEAQAEGKMESRQSPEAYRRERSGEALGHFPANLIHDGSEEITALFPDTGKSTGGRCANISKTSQIYGGGKGLGQDLDADAVRGDPGYGDTGSAARFFYCAKANKKDRGEGNNHPTVKPTDLMRYLCRLVTPPGGIVLDPFMGSGSTGKAALLEGFRFLGIEKEANYLEIARARLNANK